AGLYADESRCAQDAAGESADPRAAYPRYRPRRTVTDAALDPYEPAIAASAIADNVARSLGNPAVIHAASAVRSAPPSFGPRSTPRAMKSAALSGKTGGLQSARSVASARQDRSAAPGGARDEANSRRPGSCGGRSR